MLYVYYDEQRSFPEYVDFEIKEINHIPCESTEYKYGDKLALTSWYELYELILDGYYPCIDGLDVPEFFDLIGDSRYLYSTRRLKAFCRDVYKKYGEGSKALELESSFNKYLDTMIEEWAENIKSNYSIDGTVLSDILSDNWDLIIGYNCKIAEE